MARVRVWVRVRVKRRQHRRRLERVRREHRCALCSPVRRARPCSPLLLLGGTEVARGGGGEGGAEAGAAGHPAAHREGDCWEGGLHLVRGRARARVLHCWRGSATPPPSTWAPPGRQG